MNPLCVLAKETLTATSGAEIETQVDNIIRLTQSILGSHRPYMIKLENAKLSISIIKTIFRTDDSLELKESSRQWDINEYTHQYTKNGTRCLDLWPEDNRIVMMEACERLLWEINKGLIYQVYYADLAGLISSYVSDRYTLVL